MGPLFSSAVAFSVSHGVFYLLFIVVLLGMGTLEGQVQTLRGAKCHGPALRQRPHPSLAKPDPVGVGGGD